MTNDQPALATTPRSLSLGSFLAITGSFALISLGITLLAPGLGPTRVDVMTALHQWLTHSAETGPMPAEATILMTLRMPRVALAWMAGAALALGGAVFQAVLRNPLATPYTLGVASGGALGASLAMSFPLLTMGLGPGRAVQVWSLAGSMVVMAGIFALARGRRDLGTVGLLLAGVVFSSVCGAAMLLLRHLAEPNRLVRMDRWMMGNLDVAGWEPVLALMPFWVLGLAVLTLQARRLNALALGEEIAEARGVHVARVQLVGLCTGSLLVAAVVAATGPIGFVGLMVPHMVRGLLGHDYRLTLPCTIMLGGVFLVLCDALARTIAYPTELPVGILTAMLGGPFFLLILIRYRPFTRIS